MTATGRKKIDELYHPACERSEFYSMSDLAKPPVLFSPAEDSIDKVPISFSDGGAAASSAADYSLSVVSESNGSPELLRTRSGQWQSRQRRVQLTGEAVAILNAFQAGHDSDAQIPQPLSAGTSVSIAVAAASTVIGTRR